ncbi:MAG TPA: serine/threonine-protein kinase [Planctomycetota bacterium]|nr:serine/threonine-protein kinase [Planctomycetota bacterium]
MADESPQPAADLEDLLAAALAKFDEGGEAALDAFVRAHPAQASALGRGIRRCREMGLLGARSGTADHPDRLGEFRLLRRIGGGGMGVVYEAVQEPLGRRVALKVIRPELLYFEGARERFRREVDAIAKLDHPAIVSVFAAGEHEGVPFFTMDLIDGITIEQACARLHDRKPDELRGDDLRAMLASEHATGELFRGSWWETAARIGHQVALGLRHAHLRGIVHRDIKPSNVMITPHGQAIVLDFGVAKVHAARELTRSGTAPGSPAFMSPEQRRGQATDERTDVFSLAATIWHLLTLELPFEQFDVVHAQQDVPPLRLLLRGAPPELDLVLRTAMDPERDRRYVDIAAFAADLQAVLDRRPIEARPLGLGLQLVRWCQRHHAAAIAIAVAGGVAAVMLVVLVFVQRSSQEQLVSEQQLTRQSLDTTLDALESVVVRLVDDELQSLPQTEEVVHRALQDAAKQCRTLLQDHPDYEKVRALGGWTLHRLALSFARLGDQANATTTVREAIATLDGGPAVSDHRRYLRGAAWMTLADLVSGDGDRDATRAALERAEADFAESSTEPARRAESLRSRAELSLRRLALLDDGDPATGEKLLRDAVALQRESIAQGVPHPRDPMVLALCVTALGKFLTLNRRPDDAIVVLDEALRIAQAVPARGVWPPPAMCVADVHGTFAQALAQVGDAEADVHFRESVAAWQTLVGQYPGTVQFRVTLGGTLHNFGNYLYALGDRAAEALATFEQARTCQQQALAKSPHDQMSLDFLSKHLQEIGVCQAALGNADQVAEAARALSALDSRDPRVAVRAAECHLRAFECGGRVDAAALDAAMSQLLAAERRGLTAAQLPSQALEALQERADFRALRDRLK